MGRPSTTNIANQSAATDIGTAVSTGPQPVPVPSATPTASASAPTTGSGNGSAGATCGDADTRAAMAAGKVDAFSSDASSKPVFAHYMPNLPISIDNKPASSDYYTTQYLDPNGEGGSHAAYGGLIRDRPLPASPGGGNWKLDNLQTEVRQAKSCGITGFSVDIMQTAGDEHWGVLLNLVKAAEAVGGFKIMLMPDMSVLPDTGAADLAAKLSGVAKSNAVFRLGDGRVVVAPFMGEARSVDWWRSFNSAMAADGAPDALVPVLVNNLQAWQSLAPVSYGFSNWGMRNPAGNTLSSQNVMMPKPFASTIRDAGKIWMQPVSVQDERPRVGTYEEAANTENLRNSWKIAIESKADWVQLTTWNDYGEGSQFAPSAKHGWTNLTISQYYMKWYRTGSAPTITGNELFLTHRTQNAAARPTFPESQLMQLRGGGTPAQNEVEALTMSAKAGTVTITDGGQSHSCQVAAGLDTCTMPLSSGSVQATLSSAGQTLSSARSPFAVTDAPKVQDLQYVAVTGLP